MGEDETAVFLGDKLVTIRCCDLEMMTLVKTVLPVNVLKPHQKPAHVYEISCLDGKWRLFVDETLLFSHAIQLTFLLVVIQEITAVFVKLCTPSLAFHAAGIQDGDKAIMLCGSSGAGKSTLTARWVAAGASYLTDELLVVDPTIFSLSGFRRALILKSGSAFLAQRFFSSTIQKALIDFPNGSIGVPINQDASRVNQMPVQLSCIVFPRYQPQSPVTLCPLSAGETTFRLMQQLANGADMISYGMDQLVNLAQKISAYEIVFGDVETAVPFLRQYLR